MNQENSHKLTRRLGLTAATISGVGVIVGAGIYVIIGVAAGRAGNAVWLSFILAAAGATFTGLSYARLGRLQSKNAPEFQYMKLAFGVFPGFLTGWLIVWAVIISGAAVALGFGSYLEYLSGVPAVYGAVGLTVFMILVSIFGIRESVVVAGILTAVAVAGLLLVIGAGIPCLGDVNLLEMPEGISGVMGAASLIFFAYVGFEGMANFAEEMKNPRRDLPRAIILSLIISTLLYVLVAISAVSVLGWVRLSQSEAPLAQVVSVVMGTNANLFVTIFALASTSSTVLLLMIASSRSIWALSKARVFPHVLSIVGRKRNTPWAAIIVIGLITIAFIFFQDIKLVAELTNFVILVCFTAVNISAIKLLGYENKTPSGSRLSHILLDIVSPGLGAITCIWLSLYLGWLAALFGLGLLILGGIVYIVQIRFFQPME